MQMERVRRHARAMVALDAATSPPPPPTAMTNTAAAALLGSLGALAAGAGLLAGPAPGRRAAGAGQKLPHRRFAHHRTSLIGSGSRVPVQYSYIYFLGIPRMTVIIAAAGSRQA